jgi:hypothetical protein
MRRPLAALARLSLHRSFELSLAFGPERGFAILQNKQDEDA